jgi:hypothetical protein
MKYLVLMVLWVGCAHAQTPERSVLDHAFTKLEQVPFYRWTSSGTDYNGATVTSTTIYQAPDKYHTVFDDGTEIIFIGNSYYFYPDPQTGSWASQSREPWYEKL